MLAKRCLHLAALAFVLSPITSSMASICGTSLRQALQSYNSTYLSIPPQEQDLLTTRLGSLLSTIEKRIEEELRTSYPLDYLTIEKSRLSSTARHETVLEHWIESELERTQNYRWLGFLRSELQPQELHAMCPGRALLASSIFLAAGGIAGVWLSKSPEFLSDNDAAHGTPSIAINLVGAGTAVSVATVWIVFGPYCPWLKSKAREGLLESDLSLVQSMRRSLEP